MQGNRSERILRLDFFHLEAFFVTGQQSHAFHKVVRSRAGGAESINSLTLMLESSRQTKYPRSNALNESFSMFI